VRSAKDQLDAVTKRDTKQKGIDSGASLSILGAKMSPAQISQAERLLTVGDSLNAPYKAMLAVICAACGESNIGDNKDTFTPNSAGYWGVLQGGSGTKGSSPNFPTIADAHDTEKMGHYFFLGGKGFQAGGAMQARSQLRHHPWRNRHSRRSVRDARRILWKV